MEQLRRVGTCALACGALALSARAQVDFDWWRAYDFPESHDGDSATEAIAIADTGEVISAGKAWAGPSRFLKRSTTGALVWSKVYSSTQNFLYWRVLTATGGAPYFFGINESFGPQGFTV